jgi:hypothetical protein
MPWPSGGGGRDGRGRGHVERGTGDEEDGGRRRRRRRKKRWKVVNGAISVKPLL